MNYKKLETELEVITGCKISGKKALHDLLNNEIANYCSIMSDESVQQKKGVLEFQYMYMAGLKFLTYFPVSNMTRKVAGKVLNESVSHAYFLVEPSFAFRALKSDNGRLEKEIIMVGMDLDKKIPLEVAIYADLENDFSKYRNRPSDIDQNQLLRIIYE